MPETLHDTLMNNTISAAPELVKGEMDGAVRCLACGHRCFMYPGLAGVCRVRFNRDGELRVPGGYVSSLQVDPIEKKPFFHAFPGHEALSFGMLGCDLHCGYCQNWITSQALRDKRSFGDTYHITKERVVELAMDNRVPVIVSTYNEPLITSEWAVEIFRLARQHGITCGFVSNGNATREVLEYLRPHLDLYKVDLKSFSDKAYRSLGGLLNNVTDGLRMLVDMNYWVEVVTLIVPGFNDSEEELRDIARFLAGLSPSIPWHVTAFHPDYRMDHTPATPARTLLRAHEIGREEGLDFVYTGNLPGQVGDLENTRCPRCNELLIERYGFYVRANRLAAGRCPKCRTEVPGRWGDRSVAASIGTGVPRPAATSPPPHEPGPCG